MLMMRKKEDNPRRGMTVIGRLQRTVSHLNKNKNNNNNNSSSSSNGGNKDYNHQYLIPSQTNPRTSFILSSKVAKDFLSRHEYNRRKNTPQQNEHHDDQQQRPQQPQQKSQPCKSNYATLYKPEKPTKLLSHALTNANGHTWDRQRYCVSRAFGSSSSSSLTSRMTIKNIGSTRILSIVDKYLRHSTQWTEKKDDLQNSPAIAYHNCEEQQKQKNRHKLSPLSTSMSSFWKKIMKKRERTTVGIDIREIAIDIAVHSICHATMSKHIVTNNEDKIIHALRNMFFETLVPRNKRTNQHKLTNMDTLENVTNELDNIVTDVVDEIASFIKNQKENTTCKILSTSGSSGSSSDHDDGDDNCAYDCLIYQLLQFERDNNNDDDNENSKNYYLERKEIISNTHSALLAGTQTICTTIAAALAHLASRNDLLCELKQNILHEKNDNNNDCDEEDSDNECNSTKSRIKLTSKDIVMETLRILPPVAGLPRTPTTGNIDLNDLRQKDHQLEENKDNNPLCGKNHDYVESSAASSSSSCSIHVGDEVVIDLLSCAHLDDRDDNDDHNDDDFMKSLQFDPLKRNKANNRGYPWGIGSRKCPAGLLSVECIASVIDSLVGNGYTWVFVDDKKDGLGDDGIANWMKESISYVPTICYNRPILIHFVKEDIQLL